jgi:hypothetical protein
VAFHPLGLLTVVGAAAFAARIDERAPGMTRRLRSPAVAWSIAAGWVVVWLFRLRAARHAR